VIDGGKCVHCGACENACPILHPVSLNREPSALAAQITDDSIRQTSSSGGVFSALAMDVLAQGGEICAAVYDSDFSVYHILTDSVEQLREMRGAKYAQSRTEHCLAEIRKLLSRGIPVLFVGTPCQTASVRAYLGQDYPGLLLVDMICHGVPSPKVWQQYLQERNQTDAPHSEIHAVNLRSKSTGWSHYAYSVEMEYADGTKYSVPQGEDLFMQGFVSNLFLRPSCAECSFKGPQRYSDLTLGDYWGIWDQHPEFDDNKGTSLLLIHTEKGQRAWNKISDSFRSLEITVQEAIAQNPSAVHSSSPHPNREKFFNKMDSAKNLQRWITRCLSPQNENLLQRLLRRLRRI
jgi:coenzyme F420-reducing hydrogenase beta subunit